MAPRLTLVERRVSEEAARGLPMLISFVNRTQPIYQVRLDDAVAMLDAERERRNQCVTASAERRLGLTVPIGARARRRQRPRFAARVGASARGVSPSGTWRSRA